MRSAFLLALFALVPALGHADYCTERAQAAYAELTQALGSAPAAANQAQTQAVLERLCRDARGEGEQRAQADEPESTEILGVEIRQAPEGAAGYKRASKTP